MKKFNGTNVDEYFEAMWLTHLSGVNPIRVAYYVDTIEEAIEQIEQDLDAYKNLTIGRLTKSRLDPIWWTVRIHAYETEYIAHAGTNTRMEGEQTEANVRALVEKQLEGIRNGEVVLLVRSHLPNGDPVNLEDSDSRHFVIDGDELKQIEWPREGAKQA